MYYFALQAPSKESVIRLCNEAFILRSTKVYSKAVLSFIQQMLSLQSAVEAQEVFVLYFRCSSCVIILVN